MSWFGKLISPGSKDDSQALLSLVKKPYKDLILANTISVFDFRIYLLARQCAILGKMGKLFDVCKKSSTFLATFSRRLREAEVCTVSVIIWHYP
jgi:trafficking protein particle complex subunit 10